MAAANEVSSNQWQCRIVAMCGYRGYSAAMTAQRGNLPYLMLSA